MNEEKLVECFNEMQDTDYETLSQISADCYSEYDVLDAYLRYEGISGYTSNILKVYSLINNF